MQLEAIYEQGRLKFLKPVRFKSDRIYLKVEVPDSEISSHRLQDIPKDLHEQAKSLLDRLATIRNAPFPAEAQVLAPTHRQLERIEAFELRAKYREQQGRPA